jgi:lactam utilization protein B
MDVGCETICVHSDTPNAIEILKELRKNLSNSTNKQSNNINTNDNKLPYILSE